MTLKELEARVIYLEEKVQQLEKRFAQPELANPKGHWWRDQAGRFADDPIFDEIVRLGREYRESLRPKEKRPPKQSEKKNNCS